MERENLVIQGKVSPPRGRNILLFSTVVLLALVVRGGFQLEWIFDPARYDLAAGMDEYNYDRLAAASAAGRAFFPGVIYALPGYPALLTVLYRTAGRNPDLVRAIQSLLGALGCGLTCLIGGKILGAGGGLLAGLILVFYGPVIFFEGRLLPAAPALFFSLLSLAWWVYLPKADRLISWVAGGFLLGLAAIFAPANLLFALLLLLFWIPSRRNTGPSLFWKETLAVIGILAVLLPFAARNSRLAGGPVLLTAHSGINFFIGNNPEANGGFRTPIFLTPSATGIITDSRREAERRTGRELSPAEVSRFWFGEGWRHLAANPGTGLRTWCEKLRLIFSPREYFDIGSEAESGEPVKLFGFRLLTFGLLFPPALFGIFCLPRREPARRPLFFYLAGQVAAILLFFYQGRGRLLIVPVLAVLAAGTVRFLWQTLRERKLKRAAVVAILLAVFAAVTRSRSRVEMRSETNLLLFWAQKAIIAGNKSSARELAGRATALHPELGGADVVRGTIAAGEGNIKEAEHYYRQAQLREPFNPEPALRLCLLFLEQGEKERALEAGRSALEKDPLSWRAHSLLVDGYFSRGEREAAYRHLRRAVELNPNSARDQQNLALYYAEQGDRGMADYHRARAERIERATVAARE